MGMTYSNNRFYFKISTWGLVIALCSLWASCSDGIRVIKKFPTESKLTGRNLPQLDSLVTAYCLTKVGDKYVFGIKKQEFLFDVYDENLRFLHKILRYGNGSREWLAPLFTSQTSEDNDDTLAYVLDRERNMLYTLSLEAPEVSLNKVEDFNKTKLNNLSCVYKVDDGRYMGVRLLGQSELFSYNKRTDRIRIIQPDGMSDEMFAANRFGLSQMLTTYSNKRKAMAVAYFNFPIISIVPSDGEKTITVQIGGKLPKYTSGNGVDPHFYSVDICSSDENIYVLFDDPDDKRNMSIIVLDWDGQPVARYRTPRLTCFTFDEPNKRFIAMLEDDTKGTFIALR